ncbi:hypothetical protein STCU_01380 [Strigomonas culicis]|uniref:Uncharacterized protein n=1 Tax=Strigomonas culicis TaxID=28005 RepID=S9UUX3_9TRYP|nr:hypothetical protein STCU_01380 [Strigomonas culicis]|eukprot:EPY34722.1 hypothetical protein STCU_01380 [Strigomonas culicis]
MEQMRQWEAAALQHVSQGPIVDAPPFLKLPAAFARLLDLPFALEFLDVDTASGLVQGRKYDSPLTHQHRARDPTKLYDYTCPVCAQGGEHPCEALASVMKQVTRHALNSKLAAVLLQAPAVVSGLLKLASSSRPSRARCGCGCWPRRHPRIPRLVGEYLFGEDYHLPLPPIVAHEDWQTLNSLLRFDYILKNRTRVKTDLSKHWRKRHNQFEQFVYFYGFREEPTSESKAVNMITRSVKPGMVAMLAGDVAAVLLLHNLDFFIPYDYYWSVFPYLDEALGTDSPTYCVMRHLGLHLSSKQRKDMFNPIINPFA